MSLFSGLTSRALFGLARLGLGSKNFFLVFSARWLGSKKFRGSSLGSGSALAPKYAGEKIGFQKYFSTRGKINFFTTELEEIVELFYKKFSKIQLIFPNFSIFLGFLENVAIALA